MSEVYMVATVNFRKGIHARAGSAIIAFALRHMDHDIFLARLADKGLM